MPGQRRLNRHRRRFVIAHLADHDHVRVLPQDMPQGVDKCHSFFGRNLHLADAGQLIFNRVLHGHDVLDRRVDAVQTRVQCRALARSRRAGHKNHTVRAIDHPVENLLVLFPEAQLLKRQDAAAFVQQPQHRPLAVAGRYGADAQVDFALPDADTASTVLRHPPLGNVHPGHHLDARDNQAQDVAVQHQRVVQNAVDAVAHLYLGFERVNVDIAGPHLQGAKQDIVDQANHRRAVDDIEQIL